MAGSAGSELGEILARIDERFDRAEEINAGRFARVDECFDRVDEKFDRVDERFGEVKERLDLIENRFERVEVRIERIDARFESVDERIDKFGHVMVSGAIALSGSILASFAAVLVLIATQL